MYVGTYFNRIHHFCKKRAENIKPVNFSCCTIKGCNLTFETKYVHIKLGELR